MSIKEVAKIFEETARKESCDIKVEVYNSKTTDSVYCKIHYLKSTLMIRISDHPTKEKMTTLYLSKSMKRSKIQRYAEQKCKEVRIRETKRILDSISNAKD